MTGRIARSVKSALALLLIARAVPAFAGPLPLPMLGDMRARTMSEMSDAQARAKRLSARIADATEQFNKQTAPGDLASEGAYEKLLGEYTQEVAELSAEI